MDWKDLQEKYRQLQAEGKTAEDAAEMLKDEIGVFAKECAKHPEKMVDAMPDIGSTITNSPLLAFFLFVLLLRPRGGWSR